MTVKIAPTPPSYIIATSAERIRSLSTIGAHLLDTFAEDGPTHGDVAVIFEIIQDLAIEIDLAGDALSKLKKI